MSAAQQRVNGVQDDMLPLAALRGAASGPVVEHTASEVLWRVLTGAYCQLGFDQVDDEVFTSLVAARIVEPTSKLDTVRVLGELGVTAPHPNTLYNCLRRCVQHDYRAQVATACWGHATSAGPVALVMYDLTTLHFEVMSAYDLTCRFGYDLTCRSRHGDHGTGSPPETRVRRSLRR